MNNVGDPDCDSLTNDLHDDCDCAAADCDSFHVGDPDCDSLNKDSDSLHDCDCAAAAADCDFFHVAAADCAVFDFLNAFDCSFYHVAFFDCDSLRNLDSLHI